MRSEKVLLVELLELLLRDLMPRSDPRRLVRVLVVEELVVSASPAWEAAIGEMTSTAASAKAANRVEKKLMVRGEGYFMGWRKLSCEVSGHL